MEVFTESARVGAVQTPAGAAPQAATNEPAPAPTGGESGGAGHTEVVLTKQMGERSFGMSLVLDRLVRNAEFAVVSYIIPRSPACRAGVREGWVVLRINGQSARGRTVHDVAQMFRDLTKVAITVEIRHPVRRMPAAMPLASPAPAPAPIPQPSIASDGFEIIDVRPGNAAPAAPVPVALPSAHQQPQQPQEHKQELKQERQQEHQEKRSVPEVAAQSKVGASSMDSCPKQVVSPGASLMPKMAAKSMRQPLAVPTTAPAPAPAQIGAAAGIAALSQSVSATDNSTPTISFVSPAAPRVAEPKQSEAARVESAGSIVGTNNNLQAPSTLPVANQTSQLHAAVPVLGKRTIVTPVLHLRALPGNAPAIAQGIPKPVAPTGAFKTTPAPPLRLRGPSSSTLPHESVLPPASAPAGSTSSQSQPTAKPAPAQVKPSTTGAQAVVDGKLRATSTPNTAAASKPRAPEAAATKASQPLRQVKQTATNVPVSRNTPPAASEDEYEEKAPIPLAAATEDEYEEKAPIPAAAVTQSRGSSPTSSARPAPARVSAATPSNGSTSASRQAAPVSNAPRPTIQARSPAAATPAAVTSAARPAPSATTSQKPTSSSSKAPARASASGRKVSSKTTPSSPPSTAAQTEEAPCTPPSGPRPLPPAPARGKKRGRPRKGASSTSKASRRDAASSPAARWTAPTIEPGHSSFPLAREEYTDPPIEMYQHLFFVPSDDGDGGTPDGHPRRNASRRARPRHSLTVERLEAMGFTKEEAELSIVNCGDDLERCMVWIVSHREEIQFNEDLNQASIASEKSKRDEEQRSKKEESETLRNAKEFTRVFTTSFILSEDSSATQFKAMLDSKIGDVSAECFLREILTKLLKLESEAIRWYKQAARAYMLQLAERLEAALDAHDVVSCCSQVPGGGASSASCAFIRLLVEEEHALKHMLFSMPEIHGGVPVPFLEADETMHFSLDDDGFEVVDMPPPAD